MPVADNVGRDRPGRWHVQARRVGAVGVPGLDRIRGCPLQLDRCSIQALGHGRVVPMRSTTEAVATTLTFGNLRSMGGC